MIQTKAKLGLYEPNNKFIRWLKDPSYTYEHHKCDLFLNHKTGWMVFTNNVAFKHTLYLNMLVVDKKCKGHGTKHMEMLKCFTNETGVPISLICCPMINSDPIRLRKFYVNLGFKEKRGFYFYEKVETDEKINKA
jgi:hypothetical protein